MRRGAGLTMVTAGQGSEAGVGVDGVECFITLIPEESNGQTFASETLSGASLRWSAGEIVTIQGEVTISAGDELILEPGVLVRMGALAELNVEGTLSIQGKSDSLVSFMPLIEGEPWGEINCNGGNMVASWALFTGGGGNEQKAFGHSDSQPVLRCFEGRLTATNLFLLNNPGKAIGSSDGIVQLDSCVISRCDTGGEYRRSLVIIQDSWYFDIPDTTTSLVDDDNDAGYFNGPWSDGEEESVVRRSIFVRGKDDAIDHNGANLRVEDCVIDDFDHEGIACSNENTATILNTLIIACGQGIEAGYGAPTVTVDHCTLVGNGVGLRFGDEYLWGEHMGTLAVTNSISQDNTEHDVFDYDPNLEGPSGRITITYSIVNTAQYDTLTGNLAGLALFTPDFLLQPGSVGIGMASDGSNMGISPDHP
ncbi:right-handed parallel beta-helix repeat-containing protein [bacterium]|nr:right-handed parallel beta-helix repeat-containing protein [bacterium]